MDADRVYLDHAANSVLRPSARTAWLEASQVVGNASGLHTSARWARALLEDARDSLAADLGAHSSELIFTSGGSEADTLAVLGGRAAAVAANASRSRVLISAVEHPAVLTVSTAIPQTDVDLIGVDHLGVVRLEQVSQLATQRTAVVSVQTVNNEQGTLQPVAEVAEFAHRVGALFHTDAVQALLWPGIDFSATAADLLSLSGHKVGAPVGVGLLLARRQVALSPIGLGGGQERHLRSGTPAPALAAAMAAAVRDTVAGRDHELHRLRPLGERVRRLVTATGARLNGPRREGDSEGAHPGIISATWPSLRADDLLLLLDRAGIDASVGSACRAGVHQPSEVVLASGGSLAEALGTVRFSLGHTTTAAELDRLEAVLPAAVEAAAAAL